MAYMHYPYHMVNWRFRYSSVLAYHTFLSSLDEHKHIHGVSLGLGMRKGTGMRMRRFFDI